MNFKIAKKEFLDALSLCSRAISNNTPLPSLAGIKITVLDNSIVLISSDSNISIKTAINQNDNNVLVISETGEVVIDAKYLLDIVRKTDGEYINVETIDGTLVKIFGGNSEFKINGMSAIDYPNINFDVSNTNPFTLKTSLFSEMIDETAFACSTSETRPVLTGVNFKAQDYKLFVNATDSYRLASKTVELDSDLNFDITVPSKYLIEISHAIENKKEVTIAIDSQKISFVFGNSIIETRLLDDAFPNISRLIPQTFEQTLSISSKEVINAIDRTSFLKSDGKNIVKLNINENIVELSSSNQLGSSFNQIKVNSFEGNPLQISCSGTYLKDAVRVFKNDEVIIKFSGELRPIIVKDKDREDLIQLISPVRTYR